MYKYVSILCIMTTAAILALATGLPCVVTTHSGFPDQVKQGFNGFLSKENDHKDFAEKILQYLEEPEKWPEMSKNARKHAFNYDCKVLSRRQLEYYKKLSPNVKKIAFIVDCFPTISETWLINQIVDLIDQGVDIHIYAFKKNSEEHVSERYFSYNMQDRVTYLEMPQNKVCRFIKAIPKILQILFTQPKMLRVVFNTKKYGAFASSLKLLFWSEPFLNCDADLVHCHYGTVATKFLPIREILNLTQPFLTTFYGYDISSIVKSKGVSYYDRLKRECSFFFVMSNNMKDRVTAIGFPPKKLHVLPISENVESFSYRERTLEEGETVRLTSVGRFVEKKGFDDLIRALAIVKEKYTKPLVCSIVGGGELEEDLHILARDLDVEDVVEFKGYMKVQDVNELLLQSHLYVQASKTAKDGDME